MKGAGSIRTIWDIFQIMICTRLNYSIPLRNQVRSLVQNAAKLRPWSASKLGNRTQKCVRRKSFEVLKTSPVILIPVAVARIAGPSAAFCFSRCLPYAHRHDWYTIQFLRVTQIRAVRSIGAQRSFLAHRATATANFRERRVNIKGIAVFSAQVRAIDGVPRVSDNSSKLARRPTITGVTHTVA